MVATTNDAPVIVFAGPQVENSRIEQLQSRGVEVVQEQTGGRDLGQMLDELGRRSIQSVLVEGGATVAGKLLDAGLVNKVSFFIAPLIIGGREARGAIGGDGAETLAEALELKHVELYSRGRDIEVTGYPQRKNQA